MMSIKKVFLSIVASILFIAVGLFIYKYFHYNRLMNNNGLFIKIGDIEISADDFIKKKKAFAASVLSYKEGNSNISQVVFDNYISGALLVKKAKESGYLNMNEFKNEIQNYKKELLINFVRNEKLNILNIPEWEIKKAITDFKQEIKIDYIWVSINEKETAMQFFKYLKADAPIDLSEKANYTNLWKKKNVRIYKDYNIMAGSMTTEVMEKVSKLKKGDVTIIKTKSGYHIIRLISRANHINLKLPPTEISSLDSVRERLAIAKAIENGDSILDDFTLNKAININVLNSINFSINPLEIEKKMQKDPKIIAKFADKIYNDQELRTKIRSLPQNIQALFRNKPYRIQALASLILMENGCSLLKSRSKLISLKSKNNNLILKNFNESERTIVSLKKWVSSNIISKSEDSLYTLITDNKLIGLLDHLKQEGVKLTSVNSGSYSATIDEKGKYITWLSPELFEGLDKLKIDFTALEEFSLDNTNCNNKQTLAYSGKWKLNVLDFTQVLNSITPESRIEISKGDNAIKLIEFLARNEGNIKNTHTINVNKKCLEEIDLVGYSIDKTVPYITENYIVGEFGEIKITISMLRKVVSELNQKQREKFFESRVNFLKQMLTQVYFLTFSNKYNVENDNRFKRRLTEYENWLLLQIFYNKNIYIEPIGSMDLELNQYLSSLIGNLTQKRLDAQLCEALKRSRIQVNKKIYNQFGLVIKNSKYANQISFF